MNLNNQKNYDMNKVEDKKVICYGIDLAKSVDWTVLTGLNKDGVLIYFDRFQNGWELTKKKILAVVGDTPTLVDSTGVGDPILESLQKDRPHTIEGYKYSNSTKVHLVETLAVAIQQSEITIPSNIEVLIEELESFETQKTKKTGAITYNAAGSGHDDCVNSLAMCVMQLKKINKRVTYEFF